MKILDCVVAVIVELARDFNFTKPFDVDDKIVVRAAKRIIRAVEPGDIARLIGRRDDDGICSSGNFADGVKSGACDISVVARTTVEQVVAGATVERVVAAKSYNIVVTGAAL